MSADPSEFRNAEEASQKSSSKPNVFVYAGFEKRLNTRA